MRLKPLTLMLTLVLPFSCYAQAAPDDQVAVDFVSQMPHYSSHRSMGAAGGVLGDRSNASVLGVDSLPNWSSYFYFPGFDSFGGTRFTWQYTMVGNSPFPPEDGATDRDAETTHIGAPVIPVSLDLRNYDGSPRFVNGQRLYSDATKYVAPVMKSPIFANFSYSSSADPTQYTDAIQKAEFPTAKRDWHTLLDGRTSHPRTMVLIRGTYRFALNKDGSCCAFVTVDENTFVNELFPSTPTDTTTVMGAAENYADINTKDIATFLFPNTFLFTGGDPTHCCIIGFHSYDVEPGGENNGWKERRYVMNYSSWVSPGLFGSAFADITALSHELSETFNDPFGNNATPWWKSPNGNCQNKLEDGDVVEGLPQAEYIMPLNGMTWHPQNEALLQYFAGVQPSNAIDHAYSYPNTGVLTAPSQSLKPHCQ